MPYHARTLATAGLLLLLALAPLRAADEVAPSRRFEVNENGAQEVPIPSSAMRPAYVLPVQFEAPAPGEETNRSIQLAPPKEAEGTSLPLSREATSDPSSIASRGANLNNIVTTMASLGVVLGLFFLVTWIMRRTSPKNHQALPKEVVRVLGRAPQLGRFQLHLLQVGRKVLLVSSSTTAVTPLAEVTDADEVEQLLTLCQVNQHDGVTASFRKVLTQLGRDKPTNNLAAGEMLSEGDSPSNRSTWGNHHA